MHSSRCILRRLAQLGLRCAGSDLLMRNLDRPAESIHLRRQSTEATGYGIRSGTRTVLIFSQQPEADAILNCKAIRPRTGRLAVGVFAATIVLAHKVAAVLNRPS